MDVRPDRAGYSPLGALYSPVALAACKEGAKGKKRPAEDALEWTTDKSARQRTNGPGEAWAEAKLLADIPLAAAPPAQLQALFGARTVQCGETLAADQVKDKPLLDWPGRRADGLYTLMLIDPDAPSGADPIYKNWLHYLAVNAKGASTQDCHEVAAFVQSAPGKGSGLHRYVLLVYEQAAAYPANALPTFSGQAHIPVNSGFAPRRKFDPNTLPGTLVAGTFYRTEFSEHCTAIHKLVTSS